MELRERLCKLRTDCRRHLKSPLTKKAKAAQAERKAQEEAEKAAQAVASAAENAEVNSAVPENPAVTEEKTDNDTDSQ